MKRVPGAPGKKVTLSLRFTNAKGKSVERLSVKRAAGKRASIKVTGSARPGTYRWRLTAGKKRLASGKFRVKSKKGHAISSGASMVAKAEVALRRAAPGSSVTARPGPLRDAP